MSYNSRHEIKILDDHHKDFSVHTIAGLRRMSDDAKACVDEYGDPTGLWCWRGMEEELCLFTQHNPGLLLQLTRWGEDRGDITRTYFTNGKLEYSKALVSFPPYSGKSERDTFIEFLEQCSQQVAAWPKWKREVAERIAAGWKTGAT